MTMTPREAREILGVSSGTTDENIKKQWKKLAMKHHPDKGGDQEQFVKINQAYLVLSKIKKTDVLAQEIESIIFDTIFDNIIWSEEDEG